MAASDDPVYHRDIDGNRYRLTWLGDQATRVDRVRALAFVGPGQLLLVRGDSGMQLPGGGVEGDESPLEALARELSEEASASVVESDLLGSFLIEGVTLPLREVHCYYWCRVSLDPEWQAPLDIRERIVVDVASFEARLGWGGDQIVFLLQRARAREALAM